MISIITLSILLFIAPILAGRLLRRGEGTTASLPFQWISGQILLWAGFQLLSVPLILLERPYSTLQRLFNLYTAIVLALALVLLLWNLFRKKTVLPRKFLLKPETKSAAILWGIFSALLLLQLVLAAFLAYEEGDDAFYVAISTLTAESDTMYSKLPYTGFFTGLDARHGLAPFPIWITYLAKMAKIPTTTAAHIAAPIALILMTYAIYYLLGKKLLAEHPKLLPAFLIIAEILVLFGGYSTYSAENFLLVRTSQGKAVIANIILPFLFLLLLLLLEKIQNKEKTGWQLWFLIGLTTLSGCLCSTLGSVLTCLLLAIVGICSAISYRKVMLLFPLAACCLFPIGYALLYFTLS